MSKPPARDSEELEGALLPTAEMVPTNAPADEDTIEVEASVPSAYFAQGNHTKTKTTKTTTTTTTRYAPVIPQPYGGNPLHNSARDAALLKQGEEKGRVLNDEWNSDVRRNAQEINAIDYHQQQNIQNANQRARQTQGNEDAGFVQTTLVMEKDDNDTKIPERTAPEFYQGTYGKEYEVSEYKVGEYETSDYEVTEYKSVYD